MKANELQVGDWVHEYDRVCRVEFNSTIVEIKKDHVVTSASSKTFYYDIKPIPITRSILEKNGLHGHDNYMSCVVDISEDEWYSIKVRFAEEKEGAIISISVEHITKLDVLESKLSTIGGKTYYVHELQRALSMCKIDKEIAL